MDLTSTPMRTDRTQRSGRSVLWYELWSAFYTLIALAIMVLYFLGRSADKLLTADEAVVALLCLIAIGVLRRH